MSDTTTACPSCQQQFGEDEVVTRARSSTHCPRCDGVLHSNADTEFSAVVQRMHDVGAVDHWLGAVSALAHPRGLTIQQTDRPMCAAPWMALPTRHTWTIQGPGVPAAFTCRVIYDAATPATATIALLCPAPCPNADPADLAGAAAKHGVERVQDPDGWGVAQTFAVRSLVPELFPPVLRRLWFALESIEEGK